MQCKRPIVHGVQSTYQTVRWWGLTMGRGNPAFRWYTIIWVHDTGQSPEAILRFIHVRWSNARSKTMTKILWQATTFRSCCFVPHIFQSPTNVSLSARLDQTKRKRNSCQLQCCRCFQLPFHPTSACLQVDDLIWVLNSWSSSNSRLRLSAHHWRINCATCCNCIYVDHLHASAGRWY